MKLSVITDLNENGDHPKMADDCLDCNMRHCGQESSLDFDVRTTVFLYT